MESDDLRYFEAVARLGGMNKAAIELNTVQSNVTSRIRGLEQRLGVELFRRHSRGVELTRAGARLQPYAVKVAQTLVEARRAVADNGDPNGKLLLGSLETTAALRLSPLITAFSKTYPKVDLSLRVGSNEQLIPRILDRKFDAAFIAGPVEHPELAADTVFEEELVIACGPDQSSATDVLVSGCKILVKAPGCAYRDRLERLMADRGVNDYSCLEFGTLDAIVGCVEAGLGLTLLPRSVLASAAEKGQLSLHRLAPEISVVETLFVRRRDGDEFSALRAFTDFVRRWTDSAHQLPRAALADA